VEGTVLQPFSYDEAHPYAAGQHRGIDIGADAAGERVVAPATGTVSFAGSVPSGGESVTIQTADGYSVTLTHLGAIAVSRGAAVAEGDAVGTIGPSGTPEVDGPYIHLGIRVTSDPNGYLDPLRFLPPPSASNPAPTEPPASQPTSSGGAAVTPATPVPTAATPSTPSTAEPAASTSTPTAATSGANVRTTRASAGSGRTQRRASRTRSSVRTTDEARLPRRPRQATPRPTSALRLALHPATPQRRVDVATGSSRRPVVEATAAPEARLRLDVGHEPAAPLQRPQPRQPSVLLPLACNGAAALVALMAAFVAGIGCRRRRARAAPLAQVLRMPPRGVQLGRERRAA
jgi:hypothetical protein